MNLTKRLITTSILIVIIAVVAYFLHQFILSQLNIDLPFTLANFYIFCAIACLIISLSFIALHETMPELFNKLGLFFLGAILVKIVLLSAVFKEYLFSENIYSRTERLSMLIPIALFLIYEVAVMVKILKKQP